MDKKQNRFRMLTQALSFAFSNGYVYGWSKGKIYTGAVKKICLPGLNCYSCPGAVFACPIGALQSVLGSGKFRVSLYVFGFIGIMGMIFGRLVCGWFCPFGFIQDLLHKLPLFHKKKNLPGHRVLKHFRYLFLLLFVLLLPALVQNQAGMGSPWFCEWICPSGTLLGGIPLSLFHENLRAALGGRFIWKLALLLLLLLGSVKFDRPFCKYVCPLGALYGLANPISLYRYKVDATSCIQCGVCQRACGADIPVWEKPNSPDCIRCGKCLKACPKGAITSTWQKANVKQPEGPKTDDGESKAT